METLFKSVDKKGKARQAINRKDEINIVADNRHNPPDTGVLLALEYDGCREYVDEVHIEKVPYFVEVNDLVSL